MSLIYCTECGREISDKASNCPNCGAPVEKQVGRIILKRCDSPGAIYTVAVLVDGNEICSMKNKQTCDFEVNYGIHQIDLLIKGQVKYSETVEISAINKEVQLIYKLTMGMTTPGITKCTNKRINTTSETNSQKRCPKCNGIMTIQTIAVPHKSGCLGVLLYILLAVTIIGIPIMIIILLARKRTDTLTYAVCQSCGHKIKI